MKKVTADTRWQTIGIFGPSGGGKTTVAATAPKPIFMDSNQGLLSVAGRPGFEHVRSEDVFNFADLDRAYDNCSGTGKTDWSKKFNTIIFDHFDDIQGIALDELGERAAARDRTRRDPDEIAQKEWGIMGNRLRRYIRKFKAIPMHKILIFSEKEDRETGTMMPNLLGGLAKQLPYFLDHTIYLRIGDKGRRYLHMDPGEGWYAKTRAWWLTPEQRKIQIKFDNTKTLTDLFALIAAGPKGNTTRGTTEDK